MFESSSNNIPNIFRLHRNSSRVVSWMCGTMEGAEYVCYGIKFLDPVCEFMLYVKEGIINKLTEGIQEYINSITNIFKVSVAIDHSFSFKTSASKRYKTILSDILEDIDEKVTNVLSFFRISIAIGLIFFIWMFVKYVFLRSTCV